jgi:hypothetical protein
MTSLAERLWGKAKPLREKLATISEKTGGLYGDSAIISGLLWSLKESLGDEVAGRTAVNTLMLLGPKSDFNDFKKKIQFVIKTDLKDKNLENAEKILKDRGWM